MMLFRRIAGFAELRVTGADPERFLTALAERGVPFWDAEPPRDFTVTLRLPARMVKRAEAAAAAMGCDCAVAAARGLPALGRRLRRRAGALALLLLILAALCMSLSRIWDIEISGNETIPTGTIRRALAECGVEIGARWVGMSQDRVRNAMILRLPEIRWMTVSMQGSRANVIVREKRKAIVPVAEEEIVRVASDRAGIVTEVRALRGTAETEAGRALLPGDTVIGAYATGRFGRLGPVRAIGYARVRTWYELTAEAPVETRVKRPGAERTLGFSLILGKKRINFYKGSSICPPGCDKIIKTYTLSRAGVFTLPVTVERIVLRDYETGSAPAEGTQSRLEDMLTAALSARLGDGGEIVSSAFTASEHDGTLRVTLRAECLENTGVSVPVEDAGEP